MGRVTDIHVCRVGVGMKSKVRIIVQRVPSCRVWCPYFRDGESYLWCAKMGKVLSLLEGDYIPPECPLQTADNYDYQQELNVVHLI